MPDTKNDTDNTESVQDSLNSQRSTLHSPRSTLNSNKRGPRTEEGKRRCAMNALHHGLYAKTEQALRILRERESQQQEPQQDEGPRLEDIEREMEEFFQPQNALERRLVNRVAVCLWRLARTQEMERLASVNAAGWMYPTSAMQEIIQYERRVELQLLRSLAALGYTYVPKHFFRGNDLSPRSE